MSQPRDPHAGHDHDHDHDHGHGHGHDHGHSHDHGHDHAHAPAAAAKAKPAAKAHSHDHRHGHGLSHGHGHGHGHGHHHGSSNETRLRWALIITAVFCVVEVVGGVISGSLALIADAVHMLTDAGSLLLALVALRIAKKPADALFSYGRARYEVLAAFVNGLALLVLSGWIVVESIQRLIVPEPVIGSTMLLVALLGFAANLVSFLVLRDGEDSLNLRGAMLHVLGDLLGSAAAAAAAVAIMLTGWTPIDPILSGFVALLILKGGWRVTRESAHILLEGAPHDLDAETVALDLAASVPGVTGIHHLHAWSLTDKHPVMTMHAVLAEGTDRDAALSAIQQRLHARYGDVHATVQIEQVACAGGGCGGVTPH